MSRWKHNRDYYAAGAKTFSTITLYCFALALIFFTIFLIENMRGLFWIYSVISLIIGIVFIKLRNDYLKNARRAPSRL